MPPKARGPVTSVNDPRYVKATGHPLRLRILALLAERSLPPVQLAKELGASVGTTAYHVKVLEELGLIDLVGETRVRGAVAHHYRARELPVRDTGTWEVAAASVKQSAIAAELTLIGQRTATAAAAGAFDGADARLFRRELRLDATGRRQLERALARFETELAKVSDVDEGVPLTVVTMAFSAPIEPVKVGRRSRR